MNKIIRDKNIPPQISLDIERQTTNSFTNHLLEKSTVELKEKLMSIDNIVVPNEFSPIIRKPEIFTYVNTNIFTLKYSVKFILEVLVLQGNEQLSYLQDSDYSVSNQTLIVRNPILVEGMRIKVTYVS